MEAYCGQLSGLKPRAGCFFIISLVFGEGAGDDAGELEAAAGVAGGGEGGDIHIVAEADRGTLELEFYRGYDGILVAINQAAIECIDRLFERCK